MDAVPKFLQVLDAELFQGTRPLALTAAPVRLVLGWVVIVTAIKC